MSLDSLVGPTCSLRIPPSNVKSQYCVQQGEPSSSRLPPAWTSAQKAFCLKALILFYFYFIASDADIFN